MPRAVIRRAAGLAGSLLVIFIGVGMPLTVAAAQPWFFVNDVHYNPRSDDPTHIETWNDTNDALLASTLREMRRLAPNPPVIVMAGDFLAHRMQNAVTLPAMLDVAQRFGRAFPHAQFLIALGNEDSPCGDYALPPNSRFLRATAAAWEPLVNRNGAAPDFARTFARDGFYVARLPLHGVRAVVVDNAFWSPIYHHECGARTDPTPASFAELDRALGRAGTERRWLVMHIPPGIDAASTTRLVHHLAIVPFLRPGPRDAILAMIADPARRIELVVTGHVHRFSYRIVDRSDGSPIPLLVSPAISPILGNLPSFLTADVDADGVIRGLEEHSLVGSHWRDIGGIGTLGASEFSGPALRKLQRRLEREPALRVKFARLYMGGDVRYPDIDPGHWRPYICAATGLNSTAYRACLDEGGFSFLTRRGLVVAGAAVGAALAIVAGLIGVVRIVQRRRRAARVRRAGIEE